MIGMPQRKELFSLAYISAVAARAGYQVVRPQLDFDSVDGIFMGDEGRRPRIEFQAKATSRDVLRHDHIAFPLSRKNYDDLRATVVVPRLLILVVLPENAEEWLSHSDECLVLRRCGYWKSLAGAQDTDNQEQITVQIPRAQVLDPQQLAGLMDRMQKDEPL